MSSMKRVRLAVLFLIVAALVAGTSALAGPVELANTGTEETASGEAKLLHVWGNPWTYYTADLTVTCKGLRPGKTYYVLVLAYDNGPILVGSGSFIVTKRGTGFLKLEKIVFWAGIEVTVSNEFGDPVLHGWL